MVYTPPRTRIVLNWEPGPTTVWTPYNAHRVALCAPEQGGVYILYWLGSNGYTSFYVGQANDLRRRLLEHLQAGEPNLCIRRKIADPCGFKIARVAVPTHRDAAEAAVYWAHPDWYRCNSPLAVKQPQPSYDVVIGF